VQKKQKTVLWPFYIDSSKTRKEGRRVPKNIGVPNPNVLELQRAAEKLGMKPELEVDAAYPSASRIKTGRILVKKKGTKTQTLTEIAKEIVAIRQQTRK
jgi:signal recognition particle subunit SRP19